MCGVIDTLGTFAKDSIGEIASHPLQALGAAAGVPGYDPFFGGLFNSQDAIISPTGNFTSGAWNDMYNANPNDAGALSTMSGVNAMADKVAPAIAGGFAAPALAGGAIGEGGDAATIGADTFGSGLGAASASGADGTLGGLEAGMGGSSLFGAGAGTGTAIGSGVAQGMGAGGLGVASGSSLDGLTAASGAYTAGLGGSSTGTGLSGLASGGSQVPNAAADTGGGALSTEGSQAASGGLGGQTGSGAPMGFDQSAASSGAPGGANANLGSLSASSPSSTGIAGSTPTSSGSNMGFFGDDGTTGSGAPYGFGGNGGQATNVGVGGEQAAGGFNWSDPNTLSTLMKLGNTGLNAYQQHAQQQSQNQYANSIASMFSPNSPYAQQMQQTLARQDAAAGRNSQGGTRAVQLAAALTQAQAQAMGGNNYAKAATATPGASILNGVFSNFASPQGMQQLSNFGSGAFNSLSSLFG
jgi:hypothetical protein